MGEACSCMRRSAWETIKVGARAMSSCRVSDADDTMGSVC
jgi:hypothetical protein